MPRIAPLRKMFSRPVSSGMKAGADLEQDGRRGRAASTRPSVGSVMRRQDLQQRALPGAVAADDADDLPGSHLEGDIAKRPEILRGASVPRRWRKPARERRQRAAVRASRKEVVRVCRCAIS